eukprot:TRINITY_DN4504_c0_g1_i2.p1 TRINITY_DN4504_c0_g1~~TRINITY_DN4504_c0_g1_i2.p1  ORF type:complete len:817 (-),score=144.24 TRINITY_DN4504_c0_g1_i2:30-2423(-)
MRFLKEGGEMAFTNYAAHWDGMASTNSVHTYLALLLIKIVSINAQDEEVVVFVEVVKKFMNGQLGPPKLNMEMDEEEILTLAHSTDNLLATFCFLSLFYEYDPNYQPLVMAYSRFREYFELLKNRFLEYRNADISFYCNEVPRILNKSYYDESGIGFLVHQLLAERFSYSLQWENMPTRNMCASLSDLYIRNLLFRADYSSNVLSIVFDFLDSLSLTKDMVLVLLHIIRQYITICPFPGDPIVSEIVPKIRKFYMWPRPVCDYARDLSLLLEMEIKYPGFSLQKSIFNNCPQLLPNESFTGMENKIHLLVDRHCIGNSIFQQLLKAYEPYKPTEIDMKLKILHSILSSYGFRNDQLLEYLLVEDVTKYYDEVIILLESAKLQNETILDIEQDIQKIAEKMKESRSNTKVYEKSIGPARPPPMEMEIHWIDSDIPPGGLLDNFGTKYNYPSTETYRVLNRVCSEYLEISENSARKPVIKIGVVGGNGCMHSIALSYVSLRHEVPELVQKLDIRFYPIPCEQNDMAVFLSVNDRLYGRYIYCLTRSIFSIQPGCRTGSSGTNTEPKEDSTTNTTNSYFYDTAPTPGNLFRIAIENYFREARWQMSCMIYQCQCWPASGDDSNLITIPFCLRAEIGVKPFIASYVKNNYLDLPHNATVEEISALRRDFKFIPVQLSVRFMSMSATGEQLQGRKPEKQFYKSVCISNVPCYSDEGTLSHPSRNWLEMHNQVDREKQKPRSYHVNNIEIEAGEKTRNFDVLLDGKVYGPFSKIKIIQAGIHDNNYSLPIMSYLPIELPNSLN